MIGDELPQLPGWLGLTPYGLIVALILLFVWLLTTERLYTRGQHRSIIDPLKATIDQKDEIIRELMAQNSDLIRGGEVATDFFSKVPVTSSGETVPMESPNKRDNGARGGRR